MLLRVLLIVYFSCVLQMYLLVVHFCLVVYACALHVGLAALAIRAGFDQTDRLLPARPL